MADIGEENPKVVEFEPLPESVPVTEPPVPTPAPQPKETVGVSCHCGWSVKPFPIEAVRAGTCGWSCAARCKPRARLRQSG